MTATIEDETDTPDPTKLREALVRQHAHLKDKFRDATAARHTREHALLQDPEYQRLLNAERKARRAEKTLRDALLTLDTAAALAAQKDA